MDIKTLIKDKVLKEYLIKQNVDEETAFNFIEQLKIVYELQHNALNAKRISNRISQQIQELIEQDAEGLSVDTTDLDPDQPIVLALTKLTKAEDELTKIQSENIFLQTLVPNHPSNGNARTSKDLVEVYKIINKLYFEHVRNPFNPPNESFKFDFDQKPMNDERNLIRRIADKIIWNTPMW
jgi:hypothetical protein